MCREQIDRPTISYNIHLMFCPLFYSAMALDLASDASRESLLDGYSHPLTGRGLVATYVWRTSVSSGAIQLSG